ncbi:MAG: DUF86 domain-containing protein [Candidatus Coatesbacteria bacterium]
MRSDRDYLSDILESIKLIEKYAELGRERFQKDELVRTFMIHQIMIIGEAARGLSEAMRLRAPDVDWPAVVGMRNRLVHGYFHVDAEEVWKTVEEDIPKLKKQVELLTKPA